MTMLAERQSPQQKIFGPVIFFGAVGAIVIVLDIWLVIAWISGPYFVANGTGRELVPPDVRMMVRANELANTLMAIPTVWFVLIQPWRRSGKISFGGIFLIACLTMIVQGDLPNYTTYFYQENTYAVNMGSFMGVLPGVLPPNLGRQADFLVLNFASFAAASIVIPCILATKLMDRVKGKWPTIDKLGLIITAYLFFLIFDFVLESGFLRTQTFTYGYVIGSLTLWKGQLYQFPIYEIVLWAALLTAIFTLWYFHDEYGNSYAERGIEQLKLPGKTQALVRFFALVGAMNLFGLNYNLVINIIQLNADYSIIDKLPPYLNPGLCGPHQAYLCPSANLPVARQSAVTNRIISPNELKIVTAQNHK